jgi:hypothetical protein
MLEKSHASDGAFIYSGDSHGVIMMSEVEGSSAQKLQSGMNSFQFEDEILVKKSEYEAIKSKIAELNFNIHELNVNNEHQLRLKEIEHKNRVRQIGIDNMREIETDKNKWSGLSGQKISMDDAFNDCMTMSDEKHETQLAQIDVKFRSKLNVEAVKQGDLIQEMDAIQTRWNIENQALGIQPIPDVHPCRRTSILIFLFFI